MSVREEGDEVEALELRYVTLIRSMYNSGTLNIAGLRGADRLMNRWPLPLASWCCQVIGAVPLDHMQRRKTTAHLKSRLDGFLSRRNPTRRCDSLLSAALLWQPVNKWGGEILSAFNDSEHITRTAHMDSSRTALLVEAAWSLRVEHPLYVLVVRLLESAGDP